MPFCVSGRAAMKMISSTSSTSMSGVTFMSAEASGSRAGDDLLGAVVHVGVMTLLRLPVRAARRLRSVSVMSATVSIPAFRSASIIFMMAPYGASLSPLR